MSRFADFIEGFIRMHMRDLIVFAVMIRTLINHIRSAVSMVKQTYKAQIKQVSKVYMKYVLRCHDISNIMNVGPSDNVSRDGFTFEVHHNNV